MQYEDTFVGLIDSALINKQIEVLNAGRSSYSPIIYWRKIKYLIEDVGLQFDELVVYIDISDAIDEAESYELSDDLNVINRTSRTISQEPESGDIRGYLRDIIFHNTTVIYRTIRSIFRVKWKFQRNFNTMRMEYSREVKLNFRANRWSVIVSPEYRIDKWTIDKNSYNTYGKDGVILMEKYMTKLIKLLRERNIDLTIAVYPQPSQVWYEDLNSIQVNIWKKWSQENNVKFINYFPDFVATGSSTTNKLKTLNKYYFRADVHFNKKGNQVLAHRFINTYLNNK